MYTRKQTNETSISHNPFHGNPQKTFWHTKLGKIALPSKRGGKKKKRKLKKKIYIYIDGADPRTNVSRGFRDSQNIRANLFFEFDLMDADGSAARALYRNWVESIESESDIRDGK